MNEALQKLIETTEQAKGLAATIDSLKLADPSKSRATIVLIDAAGKPLPVDENITNGLFVRGLAKLIADCEASLKTILASVQMAIPESTATAAGATSSSVIPGQ